MPMGAFASLVGPSSRTWDRACSDDVLAGFGLSDLWGADGPLCCVGALPALVIAPTSVRLDNIQIMSVLKDVSVDM